MGTDGKIRQQRDVSPERVAELVEADEVELVDVREDYEWEAGRISDARHVELSRIPTEAESIRRDRPVVFVCRSGSRSAMVTDAFREAGFDAYNLDGGLRAWVERGLPIEPVDGGVVASHPDGS